MKFLAALLLALLLASGARADNLTVQTCGTLPLAYRPGAVVNGTVDVNGNTCISGTITASANSTVAAQSTLPTLTAGSQTPTASLAGAAYVQPVFGSAAGGGTQVDGTHGLPVSQQGSWSVSATQGTSPWVDSITTWGGGTLGAMATYGTSPGAVLVPGVNAFVTNTPPVSQSGTWTVQPGNAANTTPWLVKPNDGTNSITVKPSGTNAATTDTAQVVALSPNPSTVCTSSISVNQTASTDLVTSTNKLHICAILLVSATAQNLSLVEGTGTLCATGIAALIGGTTASIAVAANGGFSTPSDRAWLITKTTGDHLCLIQSGTGNVSGVITYLDHN